MDRIVWLQITATLAIALFALGYGLGSAKLPVFLAEEAINNYEKTVISYEDGKYEEAQVYMFMAFEYCNLYTDVYRAENVFDRERDLQTCADIKASLIQIFRKMVVFETYNNTVA